MMNNFWSRHVGKIAICSGVIGASLYWLMINVTLVQIQAIPRCLHWLWSQ